MACCMAALMLVYQVIDAWARVRRWLGMPARAIANARDALPAWRQRLARPAHPLVFAAMLALEGGFGGGLLYMHRDHVAAGAQWVADGAEAAYSTMCSTTAAARRVWQH